MRNKISKKLYSGLISTYIVVILIAITGIVCIFVLTNTAHRLVVEYNELESIQEARLSFNKMIAPAYDYLYSRHQHDLLKFEYSLNKAYSDIEKCYSQLSNRHNKEILDSVKIEFDLIYNTINNFNLSEPNDELTHELVNKLEAIVYRINSGLTHILEETNKEISDYIIIYETSSNHSTFAIIIFTLVLIFVGLKWGGKFVQKITSPISQLVKSTKIVAGGNFNIKSKIKSGDELEELSNSFNQMVDKLQDITVSRNYFDNIISSMVDCLIITDLTGKIISCNNAARDMLNLEDNELIGNSITSIINPSNEDYNFKLEDFISSDSKQNLEINFISGTGDSIPVLFSSSKLNSDNIEDSKIIVVAHNLTERKKIEVELNQERKNRLIAINEAQEKERLKIATEIHDGLGQMLTGISYSIDDYFNDKYPNDIEYREKLNQLSKQIDQTIKESKNIAYDLMPFLLKDFGLITAIQNLLSELEVKSNIKFNFQAFNCENRFNEKLEKAIYRILQEAINNIIKHSNATESNIQVIKHDESLSIVVEDNGIGFNYDTKKTKPSGIGLISMNERVNSFNGFININSEVGKGTEIVIEIPCLNRQ